MNLMILRRNFLPLRGRIGMAKQHLRFDLVTIGIRRQAAAITIGSIWLANDAHTGSMARRQSSRS